MATTTRLVVWPFRAVWETQQHSSDGGGVALTRLQHFAYSQPSFVLWSLEQGREEPKLLEARPMRLPVCRA